MAKLTEKGSITANKLNVEKSNNLTLKYLGEYEPKYATKDSACFDLCTIQKERIFPVELVKVDLGIKVEVPKGYYMEIVARSSLAKKGIILGNSVGIVDADYRGPVFAPLRNVGKTKVILSAGDRVVQAMIKPVKQVTFKKATKLSETIRGEGGYGSTGEK